MAEPTSNDPAPEMDAGTTPAPETGSGTPDAAGSKADDIEAVRAALAKANEEAARFRHELKELRPLAEMAREAEEAQKTEAQKLAEALAEAKAQADQSTSALDKLRVALAKAPPGTDMARVEALASRLQGSTVEELEADAAELFAQLAPASNGNSGARPPVESLKPGAMPPQVRDTPLPEQIATAEAAGEWAKARELKAMQLVELHQNQRTP